MTKEELKKEAEKGLDKRLGTYAYINKQNCYINYVDGYIDGAEPREKRIAELEATNKKISNECHKLVDSLEKKQKEIEKLEAQLEKLKPYRCKNHFQVSETGNAVVCYRVYDCKSCGQFKE